MQSEKNTTWLGLRLATLALALLLPALALAQGAAPKDNPRLASLGIEIWPEYDRPAALVIMKAVLAEGVKLPAAVTLRLPASSGGPSAVAFSTAANGNLLNLEHQRAAAGDYVTLTFSVPERFFHVEFYDPIATGAPARAYGYRWPGDFTADKVTVVVQEPAAASAISVDPALDLSSTGPDGLRYRAADLGALEAGKPLPIMLRYTKADQRTSVEIVKPKASAAPPPQASVPAAPAAKGDHLAAGALAVFGVIVLALLGILAYVWWQRRDSPSAPRRSCAKCGASQPADNRYCGQCGKKLA